jgi:hypothetical protein
VDGMPRDVGLGKTNWSRWRDCTCSQVEKMEAGPRRITPAIEEVLKQVDDPYGWYVTRRRVVACAHAREPVRSRLKPIGQGMPTSHGRRSMAAREGEGKGMVLNGDQTWCCVRGSSIRI